DGSDQRRLTNHAAEDHDPAWSPDGTQIAFASDRDGNSEIYVMDVDGAEPGSANVRRLTNNPAVDTDPAWSPDGTRIAFMSGPMGDFRIYIMDIDGSDVTQLPIGDGDGWSPAWSPDGTQIAFYSYRPGPYRDNKPVAIYVVSVDGAEPGSGDLRQLTDPATRSFHPIWRPSPPEIDVPPGPAPTLDGVIAPGEWDDARREQLTDGSELLLLHANGYLYVGIRANTKSTITGNIYVYRGDEIDILHSSAALGTATYERAQDGWQRTQDFVWRCRATTNSPTAQKERETFLQEEHWVANNGRMGTPGELEYQIEMPEGSLRLAVTYRAAAPERFYWPSGLDDDCITASDGPIPEKLRFSPEKWATARAMTAASVGVPEMVLVEAGSFQMGAADGNPDGQPVHEVHITRAFYIAKHEVTFEQYDQFCDETVGKNRPADGGWGRGNRAVTAVTWYDAVAYCNWLSEHEGLAPCYSGKGRLTQCDLAATGYRLPTEAEWEYAARGAQQSQGFKYAGSDDIDDVAWYGTPGGYAHPVGQKQPNELGLYDMSGNVWEWCWDLYGEGYYASAPASDPTGPASGSTRVRRGGGFKDDADSHGTTYRSFDGPTYLGPSNGFRLVRTK
ncbi:MAG: SUMF1/EgtB/PvdO family nonheme iron enzyme, partial [Chloroflexi bacterium]|nr:SUMF1/EgtB/PvdO family nonheme iron enzyme [Chloroflexota bacterium]